MNDVAIVDAPVHGCLRRRSVGEVDSWQASVEPCGDPPVTFAEKLHQRGHEHHSHDGGIEEDGEREGDSEFGGWDRSGDEQRRGSSGAEGGDQHLVAVAAGSALVDDACPRW